MKLWATKPLGEFIEERSERLGEKRATIYSVTNEKGFVRSLDQFDKQVFSADTSNYKWVEFQDLAYNPSRINVGSIAVCLDKEGGAVSPMYIIIRSNPGLLPRYLLHFLKSETGLHQIHHRCEGAVRFQLKFRDLCAIPVLVPPLAEQERIIKLLDEADELGKRRAQADRRTADLIPALFHEMFGDTHGWPTERLEKLCERITVGHVGPMATEYCETGVPFLRGQNIKRGFIDLATVLFVSEAFHRRLAKSAIRPGDIVSVRTGKPGTTAVVPSSLRIANCADLIVMTGGLRLDSAFLCELLNERLGDQDKIMGATGIAQIHFNIGEARKMEIVVPPISLQQEFAKRVTQIRELEAGQAASRLRLEALFQSLLHHAFNGEL